MQCNFLFTENLDEDLKASKRIVDDIQEKRSHTENHEKKTTDKEKRYNTHDDAKSREQHEVVYGNVFNDPDAYKAAEEKDRMLELLNVTENKLKSNNWPDLYGSVRQNHKQDYFAEEVPPIKYQPPQPGAINRNPHRQFEYRVVTDRPFVHSKTPKAYIAVSVIAPKPMEPQEDDFFLENELRQLKPWPLRQEYQEAEALQPRWIKKAQQRSDDNKSP